mgnify:CR=1 FL=1
MDDSERLARFEAVLAALLAEQESVCVTLEGLRAQGKTRTATYQQLTARKLALKSMLEPSRSRGFCECGVGCTGKSRRGHRC